MPTAALFVLIIGGGDPVGYVVGYAGLTLFGAVIRMTVNAAVPPLPLAPSQVRLKRLSDALADQLDALADGLAQPEPPSAQERGRSLQPLLEDMRRVVGQTTEARRGNRRVQRHQQAADDQYDQAKALERLTFAVQDMTQLLEDSERWENERTALGPELRPPTAEALAQLAGVLRSTAVATADADDARSAEAALDRLVDAVRRARSSTDDDLFAAASVIISLRRSLEVVVPGGLARGHAPDPSGLTTHLDSVTVDRCWPGSGKPRTTGTPRGARPAKKLGGPARRRAGPRHVGPARCCVRAVRRPMPGEIYVRNSVRHLDFVRAAAQRARAAIPARATVPGGRAARISGQAVVLVALVGGTAAYAVNDATTQLTVDGQTQEVRAFGGTVADVLEAADVTVSDRDVVAPALDEEVGDGGQVVVAHARELTLTVDGETQSHWTTALTVDEALDDIDMRADDAVLSASRSTPLGRDGLALDVVLPKDVQVLVDDQALPVVTTAATVADTLAEAGVALGPLDRLSVASESPVVDGLMVAVTRVGNGELVEEHAIAFATEERESADIDKGEREVGTAGQAGTRTLTYAQVMADGQEVARRVVSDVVTTEPVTQVVLVGTKEPEPEPAPAREAEPAPEPEPEPAPERESSPAVSDGSVWDRLAGCEAGGNWSINTGNGYYGGLQFSASSWRAVGGSGLPHEASRETQIQMGERLKAKQGWGAWPACSRKLGLR